MASLASSSGTNTCSPSGRNLGLPSNSAVVILLSSPLSTSARASGITCRIPRSVLTFSFVILMIAGSLVTVSPRGAAVAGVLERLVPVETLEAFAHIPMLGEHPLPNIYPDVTHGVYDLLEALEIHDHVVVYVNVRKVFHYRPGFLYAAVGVGGIDAVLFSGLHLYVQVTRDGE